MKKIKETKNFRYQLRDEIEQTIKLKNINRNYFHEADKFNYAKIIRKFYYTFCEYSNYQATPEQIEIYYLWTSFRKNLQYYESVAYPFHTDNTWNHAIKSIKNWLPDKNKYYYFLTVYGWLYEGTIDSILEILTEIPIEIQEFYIFPKDYHFVIIYDDDSEYLRICNSSK